MGKHPGGKGMFIHHGSYREKGNPDDWKKKKRASLGKMVIGKILGEVKG